MRSALIVGAGPAGAATACLLARRGIPVTLVERERDLERVFRGEALMPTGLDALRQMGLGAAIDALPWRRLDAWQVFLDGREILHVDEPAGSELRVVPQPPLLRLLVDTAATSPSFRFVPGASVRDVVRDGAGRVCGARVSTPGGESALEADLVVACDGRASTLRRRADLALDRLPESYDVLWFKLPPPDDGSAERTAIQIFASGAEVALAYVSWDGRLQLAWMIDKGGWRALRERDWLSALLRLLPASLAAHVRGCAASLEGPTLLDVVVGRCPRWSAPGLLLLGDAAHPMSPVRAQGINMALRDAIVAANHLVPAFTGDGDLDPAATAVQREREGEIAGVQRLQWREVRGQRWARERPWLVAPLLRVAPLLTRTRWFPRLWLRQQRPLRFGLADVRLRV